MGRAQHLRFAICDLRFAKNYYLIILQYKHTYNNNKAQLLIFIKDIMYYTICDLLQLLWALFSLLRFGVGFGSLPLERQKYDELQELRR
jgi:hypothetical protein